MFKGYAMPSLIPEEPVITPVTMTITTPPTVRDAATSTEIINCSLSWDLGCTPECGCVE